MWVPVAMVFGAWLTQAQSASPVQLTYVSTPVEFQTALDAGAQHIVVSSHLRFSARDSRPMVPAGASQPLGEELGFMLKVQEATESITGSCEEPDRGFASLAREWRQGQCVLDFVDASAFNVQRHGAYPLWVHGLIMTLSGGINGVRYRTGLHMLAGEAYFTDLSIQRGDPYMPMPADCGLEVSGDVLVAGVKVRGFGPTDSEAVRVSRWRPVAFTECTISHNRVSDPDCRGEETDGACSASALSTAVDLRLERCEIHENAVADRSRDVPIRKVEEYRSVVYSDEPLVVQGSDGGLETSEGLDQVNARMFLHLSDWELQQVVQQVQAAMGVPLYSTLPLPAAAMAIEYAWDPVSSTFVPASQWDRPFELDMSPGAAPSSSSKLLPIVAGVAASCAAVLTVCIALLLLWRRRRARRASEAGDSTHSRTTSASQQACPSAHESRSVQLRPPAPLHHLDDALPGERKTQLATKGLSISLSTTRSRDSSLRITHGEVLTHAPSPAASSSAAGPHAITTPERLEDALDDMHAQRQALERRWRVRSAMHRRVGGQGVVQFSFDTEAHTDCVIKFFLDRTAFDREARLYKQPEIREMMAAVVHVESNADERVRTASGAPLPPFIVLEKGESLDDWVQVKSPDYVTSLQVLIQVVERLLRLHAAKLVHRDLKPANILWRSTVKEWTLIDFGCAVPQGEKTSIACSLPYAPPEVAYALRTGCRKMHADTSMDIWSLGVVVYELLTSERAFGWRPTPKFIIAALTSPDALPWEDGSVHAYRMQDLGILRRFVKDCLDRDPSKRPTAASLLRSLNRTLRDATTKSTQASRSDEY